LLILAIAVPSLGSVSLPNHRIGYGWKDALAIAVIIAPLVLVLIGAARSQTMERLGWFGLWVLLVMGFAAG
jgi:hypothetical protein